MNDNREAILARLLALAKEQFGVAQVARNVVEITENAKPFVVLLDGDETADAGDLGMSRGRITPRRITMTPQVLIAVSTVSGSVGTTLNEARAKMIDAVLTDTTLAGLCVTGDPIRYEGSMTDLASGRKMQGQIALQFRLTYLLMPTI